LQKLGSILDVVACR